MTAYISNKQMQGRWKSCGSHMKNIILKYAFYKISSLMRKDARASIPFRLKRDTNWTTVHKGKVFYGVKGRDKGPS